MRRRLFTASSVLSVVLFFILAGFTILSFWREDDFRWIDGSQNISAVSVARGRIALISSPITRGAPTGGFIDDEPGFRHVSDVAGSYFPSWGWAKPHRSIHVAGFGYDVGKVTAGSLDLFSQRSWFCRCLTVPLWLFRGLTGLLPLRWLLVRLARKSHPPYPFPS